MLAEVVLRRSRGVRSVSLGRGNSVGKSLRQLRPRSLPAPRVTEAQRRVVRKTTLRKLEYTSWLRLFSKTKPRISVFLARTPPPRGKSDLICKTVTAAVHPFPSPCTHHLPTLVRMQPQGENSGFLKLYSNLNLFTCGVE